MDLDDVCDRLDNIESALERELGDIKDAIRANQHGSVGGIVGGIIIVWLIYVGIGALWGSKARYAAWYGFNSDQVTIEKKPTDCNFFRAPMGEKGCHYERSIDTISVKTEGADLEQAPSHYVSTDGGKTWSIDDANPPTKPQVVVPWDRVEDE